MAKLRRDTARDSLLELFDDLAERDVVIVEKSGPVPDGARFGLRVTIEVLQGRDEGPADPVELTEATAPWTRADNTADADPPTPSEVET